MAGLDDLKKPALRNIDIVRGDSFRLQFTIKQSGVPVPLTGKTGTAQIRNRFGSGTKILATFTVTIPIPTNGTVIVELTTVQTRALKVVKAVWDVQITDDATPTTSTKTILQGSVNVIQDATQ